MYFPLFLGVLCLTSFCNHLEEEEKACCFAVIVLQIYYYYNCSVAFLTVPLVGLQYLIVVFPDHSPLFCYPLCKSSTLQNCIAKVIRSSVNNCFQYILKVRKMAKIRKRYNQVPHLTQDTTWKSNKNTINITNKRQEVIPFQEVTTRHKCTDAKA